jgi:2-keto-4-pentenoate hydratase
MMDSAAEDIAVALLHDAATSGRHLAELPAESRPRTVAEAHAIQDRLVRRSGKAVAEWKVSTAADGEVMYGAIYAEDCHPSPAVVAASKHRLMGIEAEIAFRFTDDLPPRERNYSRDELTGLLAPFPVFEIVDSRFANYADTAPIIRLADRMSNGAMVIGRADGAVAADLAAIHVRLAINGTTVVEQVGGHARKDPLLPAIEFINARQRTQHFAAGEFITCGTFTGLRFARADEVYEVAFGGLGSVRLTVA